MREVVSRRHLALQRSVAKRTGADPLQVRTFFATGLVVTISTVLAMPDRRTDATWGAWLLTSSTRRLRRTLDPALARLVLVGATKGRLFLERRRDRSSGDLMTTSTKSPSAGDR